jgi:hypothetical protein
VFGPVGNHLAPTVPDSGVKPVGKGIWFITLDITTLIQAVTKR